MTIKRVSYYQKDGNREIYYLKTTDLSKPKCWVEGFQYRFNSDITIVAIFTPPKEKKLHNKNI